MKIKVVRDWSDANNAWIDVQTYTGLKFPPSGMQYMISFMDKRSVPAQMIVTSNGVSWVDGLGGGYKGKTILNAVVEELQVGSSGGGSTSGVLFDKVTFSNTQGAESNTTILTFMLNGEPITGSGYIIWGQDNIWEGHPTVTSIDMDQTKMTAFSNGTLELLTVGMGLEFYNLFILLPTGELAIKLLTNPTYEGGFPE